MTCFILTGHGFTPFDWIWLYLIWFAAGALQLGFAVWGLQLVVCSWGVAAGGLQLGGAAVGCVKSMSRLHVLSLFACLRIFIEFY